MNAYERTNTPNGPANPRTRPIDFGWSESRRNASPSRTTRGTGKKTNLEIKVFGGGKINAALDDVGAKNIEFVREFLANEGYVMTKEDLGGAYARRVMFKPASGRAFVKRLDNAANASIAREELAVAATRRQQLVSRPAVDDIELF